MESVSRLMLAVFGAMVGALLAGPTSRAFGAAVGGLLVWLWGGMNALSAQLDALGQELQVLQRLPNHAATASVPAEPAEPAERVLVPPEPEPEPEPELDAAPVAMPPSAFATTAATSLPDLESVILRTIRGFLFGGNAVVRIGIVILFFGIAFLLRYLAEHTTVPVQFRLSGIAMSGLALIALGWRLRKSRTGYALALQGGGVAVLYLTVFGALRLYGVLPATIAFPLLAAIAAASGFLAVSQNSMWLALLGVSGGFLAPILASTGQGSHVALFTYYLVLNAGIFAMAWFKAWRPLNLAGFVFTFAIGTVWGVLRYQPEAFASTEPFLIAFWLFYLIIAILFTTRQPLEFTGLIDGTLTFGTPILVFTLQSLMLRNQPTELAVSALMMGAVYLSIAALLKKRQSRNFGMLVRAFVAVGVALVTIAVPLGLSSRWTAAAWALEGTSLVWVGCRQRSMLARGLGGLLTVAAGCVLAAQFDLSAEFWHLSLADYVDFVLMSVSAVLSAHVLHRHRHVLAAVEGSVADVLFCWGVGWWSAAGVVELDTHWHAHIAPLALILPSATTLLCAAFYTAVRLPSARAIALLQYPVMLGSAAVAVAKGVHPFADLGGIAWLVAFGSLLFSMKRLDGGPRENLSIALHAGMTWLFCGLLSWETAYRLRLVIGGSNAWAMIGWAAVPCLVLCCLPYLIRRIPWPFAAHRDAYLGIVATGVAAYLAGWSAVTNFSASGDMSPLPYVPLVNALDLGQAAVLFVLWRHLRVLRDDKAPTAVLSALVFLWLNAVLLRTLHEWFGVNFDAEAMIRSTLVQTSLSILWAVTAFGLMLVATRQQRRAVWLVGVSLLGVVIAKLFLVDLSRVGSIERIVSFVGVGILMLIVGYLSPLPPALKRSP
jgi:uncharacterized membrane protein